MWRWLHSLPRAVRQQFHGSGASAGLHVEEHHEVEVKKENWCRWKFHRKQKQRLNQSHNKDDKDEQGSKPENNEFWRCVQKRQAVMDAVGLGGLFAVGMEMGRHKCSTYQHLEEQAKQLLFQSTVIHALPRTVKSDPTSTNVNVKSTTPPLSAVVNKKKKSELSKSQFSVQQDFEYISEESPVVENKNATKTSDSEVKEATTESSQSPAVETLEEAFQQFQEICNKYTAVGKGIMGSQEAQKKNYKCAAKLWEESSQLGHAKSHFNLAVCYETGQGVKPDFKEAARLYSLAAEDLHPQAMYNLGMMYIEGTAHPPGDNNIPHTVTAGQKGIELITLAADFGLAEAQCYMGIYYTQEETENEKKAVHYLTLSANQKNIEAVYSLAFCYQHGYGVDENMCKAAVMFRQAADEGHADAMYSLATLYRYGLGGLLRDVEYSNQLVQKAADIGSEEAIQEIQKWKKEPDVAVLSDSIHHCASSPCLTDLVRQNMISVNSNLIFDPVNKEGTLSQLFTQLLIPRGLNVKSSKTLNQDRESQSPSPTNLMDSKNSKKRKDSLHLSYDAFDDMDKEYDSLMTCSTLHARTSTMPDLSVIPCK